MWGLVMLTYNIGVCVRLQKSADTYIYFIISKKMDSLVVLVLSVAFNLTKLKLQNLIINCKFKSLLVELLMSWVPEAILSLLK